MKNDRFKIRIFDNKLNQYVMCGAESAFTDVVIDANQKYIYCFNLEFDCGDGDVGVEGRYSFEQSTGIYDRNQQLIFDGDVLMYQIDDWYGNVKKHYCVVKWDDERCCFSSAVFFHNISKIVGNVHEVEKWNDVEFEMQN